MKLWLVCFFILFFGAETAQWLGQLPWLGNAELSLPLTIAGGIGLAIASNYRPSPKANLPAPTVPPQPTAPLAPRGSEVAPVPPPPMQPKASTISFDIKRAAQKPPNRSQSTPPRS
jgi:hypothetical protein